MNFFQDFKPEIKTFLIVALVAVILSVGGILLLKKIQKEKPEITVAKPFTACVSDDECIVVPAYYCCIEASAINKNYEEAYSNNPETIKDPDFCAVIECGDADLNSYTAQCVNNKCVPIRKETKTLDTSTWQTYRNDEFGFELQYPSGGKVIKTSYGPRIMLLLAEEGTNLSEKYLDIAIDGPSAHTGGLVSSEQVSSGGNLFMKEIRSGAAAGNIYDTESYLINYEGRKYNLSFTLHSGNIGHYDPSIRPKEFNKDQEKKVFDQILSTFRFTPIKNGN